MVVGEQRARAATSLGSLIAQRTASPIEILVADLRPDLPPVDGFEHDRVRVVDATRDVHIGPAMAHLAREAGAPLIAFVEEHTHATAGWAQAVIDAFDRPDVAIVNYAMQHAGRETWLSRSFLFTEYGRWMDPAREGPVSISTVHNVAYRVRVLLDLGDRLEEQMDVAHLINRSIQRDGGVAWQSSRAKAAHEDLPGFLAGCRANAIMKRLYAGFLAQSGWSLTRRVVYAGGMAIAPALHLGRLAWSVRRRPRLWTTFITSLPVSVSVYVSSSFHEALGYLFGPGDARDRYTEMEVGQARSGRRS